MLHLPQNLAVSLPTVRALVLLACTGAWACDSTTEPGAEQGDPHADGSVADAHVADPMADGGIDEVDAALPPDASIPFVGVNDVSYLFPLPVDEQEVAHLLALDAAGAHGELMPSELFATHIPRLWEGPGAENAYPSVRVTALRLDPCGGQTTIDDPSTCRPEIRLSAQPMYAGGVIDAALHLIYEVTRDELDVMLSELLALKQGSTLDVSTLPLQPHPIMVEQGLDGVFARGVRAAILAHLGVARMIKFTFMDRGRNSDNWRFHLIERTGDTFAPATIPATGTSDVEQGVDEVDGHGGRFTSVHPVDDALGYPAALLISDEVSGLAPAELKAALDRLASFEDPERFSSLNLDCATCHVNTNARSFYEEFTQTTATQEFEPPEGQNMTRLDQTERSGRVLISFGYFGDKLVVSQRVINESARVADWLSRRSL